MPTKIRLQRHGKKRNAFYHIVIADNRAPRDGKFIEKIGTYNPNTNPATIDLSFDKALSWVKTGAQPTDTVRAILSYEGVLYKNHLDIGVKKGAFSEDEANKRFEAWKKDKLAKIQKKVDGLEKAKSDEFNARMKAEQEVSKKREQDILAKTSAMAEEVERAQAAETTTEEAPTAETATEEAPAAEAATEEAPAAEAATEEAPAAEAATEEAPAAEAATEEAPAAEAATEEAPAAEAATEEAPAAEAATEEAPAAEAATEEAPAAEAASEETPAEEEKKDEAAQ